MASALEQDGGWSNFGPEMAQILRTISLSSRLHPLEGQKKETCVHMYSVH